VRLSSFSLIVLSVGLAVVQLSLADKSDNSNLWGISLVCWCAAGSLFWQKRDQLDRSTPYAASFLGACIIGLTLLKSLTFNHTFPYLFPLLAAVGLILLASGWNGFKQYRSELIILGSIALLNFPVIWFFDKFDTSLLTAKTAAVILWHLGLNVVHQGQDLRLNHSGVVVYAGCSGIESMVQLLNLAIVFNVLFLKRWSLWVWIAGVAIVIGFIVNACRVALLAYLSAYSTKTAFEYWHQGTGSLIFSGIAVALLGVLGWGMLVLQKNSDTDEVTLSAAEKTRVI
jgi:cyanoexosortase A